jgi:lysine biosynthesis protein LysW
MSKVRRKSTPLTAHCGACHSRIRFDERPELYDIVNCPECDEAFEVIRLSPIKLDWPSDFNDDDKWPNVVHDGESRD